MGVVRGLNASMTSLSHICWSKKQFLSDLRQKATQSFISMKLKKLLKKYILSGQPSGCFSLCPDLRKSTTSIPPNPEYGIKPELKVRKETLLDEWFPHFTLGWLWILGSRDCWAEFILLLKNLPRDSISHNTMPNDQLQKKVVLSLKYISHFRVPQGLWIKTRLNAQPLIWKWFFILKQVSLIFTRKVVHLASFWTWEF